MGYVQGFHIKIHLYTLPLPAYYNISEQILLKDIDGVVYLVDSQTENMPDNIDYLREIQKKVSEINPSGFSQIFQYNKRDIDSCVSTKILEKIFNPKKIPFHESIATKNEGVMETLTNLSKQMLDKLTPREKL